jgi:hypothetical protein
MIKQEDIIKPLIFLDIFDYPPTAIELWRFLGVKAGLGEVMDICHSRAGGNPVLSSRTLDPRLRGDDNGFYFLSGREELIEKRREFFQLSEKKFKIAKRAAWLLHFIPSIKMIAICNNFYYRPQSDIDFFIITAANRLWLTRFFATIILDIFGLRARGKKRADKICLSFYLSEENMSLESVVLKPAKYCGPTETDDPYLSYWLAFLEPIYGQECYNKFWEANAWLKNIFPNIEPKRPVSRRQVGGIKSREYTLPVAEAAPPLPRRGLSAYFGDWLEKLAKKIQWWKISVHVKEMAVFNDSRVVINDAMLKFHENDRREFYREKCINELNNF